MEHIGNVVKRILASVRIEGGITETTALDLAESVRLPDTPQEFLSLCGHPTGALRQKVLRVYVRRIGCEAGATT